MIFEHWRTRRRLSLLAMGVLDGSEAEAARRHCALCPRCAAELADLERVTALLGRDPLRNAAPPIDDALLARLTLARVATNRAVAEPRAQRSWRFLAIPAAAAALAAVVLAPRIAQDIHPSRETVQSEILVPEMALRRMERNVAREQAVRYLNDAQDVLVTVASAPQLCDRQRRTLDMGEETRRSRDLLSRRAMLVDLDSDEVRAARPILEDIERVLREVAVLDPCARPQDLDAIHAQLREGRLLMKINLMTRELAG
jgi:hypothetical protein